MVPSRAAGPQLLEPRRATGEAARRRSSRSRSTSARGGDLRGEADLAQLAYPTAGLLLPQGEDPLDHRTVVNGGLRPPDAGLTWARYTFARRSRLRLNRRKGP